MPSPAYSTCFLQGRGTGAAATYVVPAGKRAVVAQISIVNFAVIMPYLLATVNGYPVHWRVSAAANSTEHITGRWVAYAGQSIAFVAGPQDIGWHLGGFLFTEP